MSLFTKDSQLISPKKRKKRKGLAGRSTIGMSEANKFYWRKGAKRGDAFETEGAYGDKVFVPKTHSDIDPAGSRLKNRLQLERMRRVIDYHQKRRKRVRDIT